MNNFVKIAALSTFLVAGSSMAAPIATGPVDQDAYVTFKGYDLAWASPCSSGVGGVYSCGAVDLSVQAAYGWKIMTFSLFQSLGYDYKVFEVNYTSSNTQAYMGKNYAKASKWFNDRHRHIDVSDAASGRWSFADVNPSGNYETIVYRTSQSNSVPTSAPWVLFSIGMLALALTRKAK